jgi:cell division protein FtsZ
MIQFELDEVENAKMKVIGVGGAGGNAVNRMMFANLSGVDFLAMNTDCQALARCSASQKIQLGAQVTRGLGSGGDPEMGRASAEEDREMIREAVAGADMVFITAGMGGGTGTGASPVVAEIAKEAGALTVGIITKPFLFEGMRRMRQAEEGIAALRAQADTVVMIPNQKLLQVVSKETPLVDAFAMADDVLLKATRGISDLITRPGEINLDFADVRAVMAEMGDAILGTGTAGGENRAREAANRALHSPLLDDVCISGARGLLINITGSPGITLTEVSDAAGSICEAAGADANVIFGTAIDEMLDDEVMVTVIATGIGESPEKNAKQAGERNGAAREGGRIFQRAFRKRETVGLRTGTDGPADASLDIDYETPAFLRRHAD